MSEKLGLKPGTARIFIPSGKRESVGVIPDDYVAEYDYWHLVLQPEKYRNRRGKAAGLIIAKREVLLVTDLQPQEWQDMQNVLQDGPAKLCDAVGAEFTGHFTGPAFNNGPQAGQTEAQVHAHLYPVIAEDLPEPGQRNGMGAMVEALRQHQGR